MLREHAKNSIPVQTESPKEKKLLPEDKIHCNSKEYLNGLVHAVTNGSENCKAVNTQQDTES